MGIFDNFSLDQFAGGLSSGIGQGTQIGARRSAAERQQLQAQNAQKLAQARLKMAQEGQGLAREKFDFTKSGIEAERASSAEEKKQKLSRDLAQTLSIQNAIDAHRDAGNLSEPQIAQINALQGGAEQAALLSEIVSGNQKTAADAPLMELERQKILAEIGATGALEAKRRDEIARGPKEPALPTEIRTLQALGIEPTLESVKDLAQARSTQVNVGNAIKPPSGFYFKDPADPKKGVDPLPGGPADPAFAKNLTGEQRKTATTVSRLGKAASKIAELEKDGFNPAAAGELAKAGVPVIGDYLKSDNFKNYETHSSEWTEAYLREVTGAQATVDEVNQAKRTFFPVAGDSEDQVALKAQLRESLQSDFVIKAGAAVPPAKGDKDNSQFNLQSSSGVKYRVVQ